MCKGEQQGNPGRGVVVTLAIAIIIECTTAIGCLVLWLALSLGE